MLRLITELNGKKKPSTLHFKKLKIVSYYMYSLGNYTGSNTF